MPCGKAFHELFGSNLIISPPNPGQGEWEWGFKRPKGEDCFGKDGVRYTRRIHQRF